VSSKVRFSKVKSTKLSKVRSSKLSKVSNSKVRFSGKSSKTRKAVQVKASCPRHNCLSVASHPRQGKLSKANQVVAGCQWLLVQGKTTCPRQDYLSKSRILVQLAQERGIAIKKAGRKREIIR